MTRKPLRLWPGVVIVIVQWLLRFVFPIVVPDYLYIGVLGALFCGLLIVVWWVFFSRAPWSERLGAVALMAVALFVTSRLIHKSIAGGAMGMLFPLLVVPVLSLAFVVWAVATRNLSTGTRRVTMAVAIFLGCGVFTLIRTGGFTAELDNDFAWRWTKSPEERLLAQATDEPVVVPPAPAITAPPKEQTQTNAASEQTAPAAAPAVQQTAEPRVQPPVRDDSRPSPLPFAAAEWPGFRGPERDGIVRGVRIKTDWSSSPPVQMWRRPIGPGWSSFAVQGQLLYTQEQRGEDEMVSCYNVTTGEPVWKHRDAARFWESNGGAGPRGTPTLSNGRVYTLGATGILNALSASDGAVVWSRNSASDTKTEVPGWGFASSPLVVDDVVIVATAGKLAAYDVATGKPRWYGPAGGDGYSSPQLMTLDGVAQVVLLSGAGATSVAPADGKLRWKHSWKVGTRICQPAITADGDVLIGAGEGIGRVGVANGPGGWTVKERWKSIGLKPYFNDFVVRDGYAFGFDGSYLASIDLADGTRKWKGGRYGAGQLVLLTDQGLLLVVSEKGDLALVNAAPDKFTELARFPAIEGKTWNHPVVVGDVLLVRNGQEMAAFKLPLEDH